MQINQATLDGLYYNFDARFAAAYLKAEPWYTKVASDVPSTSRENRYPFLAMIPRFREWVGERTVRNVANRVHSIVNKDWELTIELDRNDIEDETFAAFSMSVEMLGEQAKKWPDDLITTLIQGGTTGLCFDGQYFFDTDHPVNLDDSSLSTYANNFPSTALSAANYEAVRAAMMAFKGDDNRPLRINPNLLVVPPQLEVTARKIVQADTIATVYGSNTAAASTTNVLKGSADVLVIPELANEATTWYLLDTTKPIKPFIMQTRKTPQLISKNAPQDDNLFWKKKYVYGSDARGNGGYALPFLACRGIQ